MDWPRVPEGLLLFSERSLSVTRVLLESCRGKDKVIQEDLCRFSELLHHLKERKFMSFCQLQYITSVRCSTKGVTKQRERESELLIRELQTGFGWKRS